MKKLLRNFLFNLVALTLTAKLLPTFMFTGSIRNLLVGTLVFMMIGWLAIPLLKIMLLPLNLLTLGLFSWIANVIGIYLLTIIMPQFQLLPYTLQGVNINGFIIPEMALGVFGVAAMAALLIGFTVHFLQWLMT